MPGPIDLTQVRTFVHLYETRAVTATAEAMRVSQPTVSYTLSKLRRRFGDDLFVRTPRGLLPTGISPHLYAPLRAALEEIDRAVSSAEKFDPATTGREFTVMMSDFGELSFLPLIIPVLGEHAPHARLRVRPLVIDAVVDLLVSGELDLVLTSVVLESERLGGWPPRATRASVTSASRARSGTRARWICCGRRTWRTGWNWSCPAMPPCRTSLRPVTWSRSCRGTSAASSRRASTSGSSICPGTSSRFGWPPTPADRPPSRSAGSPSSSSIDWPASGFGEPAHRR